MPTFRLGRSSERPCLPLGPAIVGWVQWLLTAIILLRSREQHQAKATLALSGSRRRTNEGNLQEQTNKDVKIKDGIFYFTIVLHIYTNHPCLTSPPPLLSLSMTLNFIYKSPKKVSPLLVPDLKGINSANIHARQWHWRQTLTNCLHLSQASKFSILVTSFTLSIPDYHVNGYSVIILVPLVTKEREKSKTAQAIFLGIKSMQHPHSDNKKAH